MKRKNFLIVFIDILQIVISIITLLVAIFILMNDSHDFTKITFLLVSFISLITAICGLSNFKVDYIIYKKYTLV